MYNIRPASIHHVDGIARVHVACWTECYPYLPSEMHRIRGIDYRRKQWQTKLSSPGMHMTWILSDASGIAGFSHIQLNMDPDLPVGGVELHACYFLPRLRRGLAGPNMMQEMLQYARSEGHASCSIWAWDSNPLRRTYNALGFLPLVRRMRVIGGAMAPEVGYHCDDLDRLERRLVRSIKSLGQRDVQTRNLQYSPDRFRPTALRSCIGQ
ncbi:GNAT family N-acetyltransferase [Phaeobacter gallaeciensis]|uniref:GNAT family N-acetyltransferase n=1 Tax=Phaeobacter gallaeciensis TaxID=60890 RepID=UPI0026A0D97E